MLLFYYFIMNNIEIKNFMEILKEHFKSDKKTTLNRLRENPDAFKILIGCIVSINIKDEVTEKILDELFKKADSFQKIIDMNVEELENILYLARYRKIKANTLKSISREIIQRFNGNVPNTKEELLSIRRIGPKTANVVLNFAFNKSCIPIDSNTLRIANRIGWIKTQKHEEVENLLIKSLDDEMLKNANAIFMLHGKNICVPVSPFCSKCPVSNYCMKVGVLKSR